MNFPIVTLDSRQAIGSILDPAVKCISQAIAAYCCARLVCMHAWYSAAVWYSDLQRFLHHEIKKRGACAFFCLVTASLNLVS